MKGEENLLFLAGERSNSRLKDVLMGCTKVEKTFSPQFSKRCIALSTSNKSLSILQISITEINYPALDSDLSGG